MNLAKKEEGMDRRVAFSKRQICVRNCRVEIDVFFVRHYRVLWARGFLPCFLRVKRQVPAFAEFTLLPFLP